MVRFMAGNANKGKVRFEGSGQKGGAPGLPHRFFWGGRRAAVFQECRGLLSGLERVGEEIFRFVQLQVQVFGGLFLGGVVEGRHEG